MVLGKKEYCSLIGFMQCGWMVVRSGVCMSLHMFPVVRLAAAVSEDVVTSTKLYAMDGSNLFTLQTVQAFDHGGHTATSTVVTLHEADSLTLHIIVTKII